MNELYFILGNKLYRLPDYLIQVLLEILEKDDRDSITEIIQLTYQY